MAWAVTTQSSAGSNTSTNSFTAMPDSFLARYAILGLSKQEIDERLSDIIEFADIGIHIDQPVKTYSSGMFIRLAFSIATSVEPDVLIIDEALSP
ncbi:MAG: ATP-binding cassette domain-containing protein, partial [Chloroflexota bacterium]